MILAAANMKQKNSLRGTIVELIGFIVFALGSHAIAGYLQAVPLAYSWGTDTRMSIPTALCDMMLGAGLMTLSWYQQKGPIARVPLWVPGVLCFLALEVDMAASPHIIASIVYIPLVFCALGFNRPLTVFAFAFIATFLTLLRYALLPSELMTFEILSNRFLTVGVIWFVASLAYWQKITSRKFERSEKYLSAVVDNTIDGLIVIDELGTVKSFNRGCERIFGFTANEVIGHNLNMLMPAPYKEQHDQYIKSYLDTGHRKIIGIGREVEGKKIDGTIFPLDLSVSEFYVEGQRYFSGMIRDITARKMAEEELLRSNTELERFAFLAAHDLQEPLRIIIKCTEFLQEECGETLTEGAASYTDKIGKAALHMRALVRDLLDYSRIGNEERKFEQIELTTLIQMALENMGRETDTPDARIEIASDLPTVAVNPVQLVRLYQNLIGNGLKYRNKKENIKTQINIGIEQHPQYGRVFFVSDNGIGIDPQYLEQIFVPFKRLHSAKDYPGTGIGLAMCKRIVENHNGRIWVDSKPGQGSTFYFTLN